MGKKIILILLLAIICLIAVYRVNSNYKSSIVILAKDSGAGNKNLVYRVYFLGLLPVGEAIFNAPKSGEFKGRKIIHLSAQASSLKVYSRFFRGSAQVDSYLNQDTLNPELFKQRFSLSGKLDTEKVILYDQEKGEMLLSGVNRKIEPDTQDPLSLFFKLRKKELVNGGAVNMNINSSKKNYVFKAGIKVKLLTVKRASYEIAVLDAEIKRKEESPYHKTQASIIFLKGEENLPIFMKVFSGGVLITMRLIRLN